MTETISTENSKDGLLKRTAEFIAKDTGDKNESKNTVVMLRIIAISLVAYFVANVLICSVTLGEISILMFFAVFMCIYAAIFIMSYKYKTSDTLRCFNASTLIWIVANLQCLGWNIGVQHFLMLQLILFFFSRYRHYAEKVFFAVSMCVIRLILFYLYHAGTPLWQLTSKAENMLQILNTVTIFWCISVVAFVFSRDSQMLEGKLIDYNNQLEKMANTDTLTGLYNRRKAIEYMESMVKGSGGGDGFSLCICDIDFFKKVNDSYGHDFGDEVLKKVSEIFKEATRNGGFAARWGGEEFLLLFPGCNGDNAYIRLEEVRRIIENTRVKKGELQVGVTMTFGLAEYDFTGGLEATIKEADQKLYMGKENGRNRVVF
jgi:diguanylate cyclase (GGDEF)-like protein